MARALVLGLMGAVMVGSAAGSSQLEPGESKGPANGGDQSSLELHREADRALTRRSYSEALRCFRSAIQIDPNNATLHYGLGAAYAGDGRTNLALESLERAVELGYRDAAVIQWDRDTYRLRREPRFAQLVEDAGGAGETDAAWRVRGSDRGVVLALPTIPWIALASTEHGIDVIDRSTGKLRKTLGAELSPAAALALAPDGKTLASLHVDGGLALFDLESGEVSHVDKAPLDPAKIDVHRPWAASLAYGAMGKRIVAWTGSGLVIWNSKGALQGTVERTPPKSWWPRQGETTSRFVPEVSGQRVLLHDLLEPLAEPRALEFDKYVAGAQLSPDGTLLAVGLNYGGVRLVDVAAGGTLWSATMTCSMSGTGTDVFGSPLRVPRLTFDPAGERLGVSTTTGYYVGIFAVDGGASLWRTIHLGGRMGAPMDLLLGNELAVGDRGWHVWDAESGEAPIGKLPKTGWTLPCRSAVAVLSEDVVLLSLDGLELCSGRTGALRWSLPWEAGTERRVEHPSGWFTGSIESVDSDPTHFDPKRLRAAIDGVALLPVEKGSGGR